MVPEKGHVLLLRSLKVVIGEGVDVNSAFVGDGPERRRIEGVTEELDLGGRVRLIGVAGEDQIRGFYEQANVFVLPSLAESLPVVLTEAMGIGLPVTASHVMGIPELVQNGVNGMLVRSGSVRALAEAMAAMSVAPELRIAMGRKARETICQSFDHCVSAR